MFQSTVWFCYDPKENHGWPFIFTFLDFPSLLIITSTLFIRSLTWQQRHFVVATNSTRHGLEGDYLFSHSQFLTWRNALLSLLLTKKKSYFNLKLSLSLSLFFSVNCFLLFNFFNPLSETPSSVYFHLPT